MSRETADVKECVKAYYAHLSREWLARLRGIGFQGALWRFQRLRKPFVDCVWLSYYPPPDGPGCIVMLGVDLTFDKDVWNKPVALDQVTAPSCAFQQLIVNRHGGTVWPCCIRGWFSRRCDPNRAISSAQSLINAFDDQHRAFFQQFNELPGILGAVTPQMIRRNRFPFRFSFPRGIGMCYILAQMYLHIDDRDSARDFAELGLQLAQEQIAAAHDRRTERGLRPIRARFSEMIAACENA